MTVDNQSESAQQWVSVLFGSQRDAVERTSWPACFPDLGLDTLVQDIIAGREEYDLAPLFYTPLSTREDIQFRQAVFRDFADASLVQEFQTFAERMRTMRRHLAQGDRHQDPYQPEGWFLEAAKVYCTAVGAVADALHRSQVRAPSLLRWRQYLDRYREEADFRTLAGETDAMDRALAALHYRVRIRGSTVEVEPAGDGQTAYARRVTEALAPLSGSGPPLRWTPRMKGDGALNTVEGRILALVAKGHPAVFESLTAYCRRHANYLDEAIWRFDREIQFYLAYHDFMARLAPHGLVFSVPELSEVGQPVMAVGGFDAALAIKRVTMRSPVVVNSFRLEDPERMLVVTGPNQGGKTTFARMFGQMHYLARLGCPVPASEAQLFLYDQLFTHFPTEEDAKDPVGRLEDEIRRIVAVLGAATSASILIVNEIFQSTTLADARFLSAELMRRLLDKGLRGVWVTFLDDLAAFGPETVSMVATVTSDGTATRTYRIVRGPAQGRSYAMTLAERHRLTAQQLKARLRS